MTAPTTESRPRPSGWIASAKWICAISSFLLAVNLVVVSLLVDLGAIVVVQNVAAAMLFLICGVGYLMKRKWVILYTRIIVLLLFIGAGVYWLRTKQWIGLLPSALLLLLIFQSNKLESSLKAQPGAAPNGGPATPVDDSRVPKGPSSVS
jgi:hypothetical protein